MNLPAPIYNDKKLICTSDGSFTFYSLSYGESYKAKSVGAYTESLHKFVNGSGIINKLLYKDIRLLDICFGIGMNLAATIEKMLFFRCSSKLHAVSVEKDARLPLLVAGTTLLFPRRGYAALREAMKTGRSGNFSLELYINDALNFIKSVSGKFNVIYFDPFSKKHNPEMWTKEVFERLYNLLEDGGCLVTYASGKTIRTMVQETGFRLTEIYSIGSRHQPSIYAEK